MRSLTAPAFLTHELSRKPSRAARKSLPLLVSKTASKRLAVLALGELVADKAPGTPARIAPPVITARILSGAISGAAVARGKRASKAGFALIGAVAAVASSFAFYGLRTFVTKRLRIPNVFAGLVEDGLALALGARLAGGLK
jgi:uncharacterized membrane protein